MKDKNNIKQLIFNYGILSDTRKNSTSNIARSGKYPANFNLYNVLQEGLKRGHWKTTVVKTTAQRDNLTNKSVGDVIYNSDEAEHQFWNGTSWVEHPVYDSNVFSVKHNIVSDSTLSSNILGGTAEQPNLIGKEFHVQYFDGDGSTTDFTVDSTFIVNDLQRVNIRGNVLRSDGILTTVSTTSGLSVVSGYGTNSIIVRFDTAPEALSKVEVTIYGEDDDSSATPTLISTLGYDNAVNPIMSNALGAHGKILNGNGHNNILGGSFSTIGGSYNTSIGGKGVWIGTRDSSTAYTCAGGSGVIVDGVASLAYGQNVDVQGNGVMALGKDIVVDNDYVFAMGRGVKSVSDYEVVTGGRLTTDTVYGLHTVREAIMVLETTDAAVTPMKTSGGQTNIETEDNTATVITVKLSAVDSTVSKFAGWEGTFLYTNEGSGTTPRINGSSGDVALTSVSTYGSPTWSASVRALTSGSNRNFYIRCTGAASETIRWTASVTLVQSKPNI